MRLHNPVKGITSWSLNSKAVNSINSNSEFVKSLSSKYEWSQSVKSKVSRDLEFIKEKQADNNLNLSIIGEFSSGKSTFINALLREDLLEADVLQGTTVASSVIRYSKKIDLMLNYKNGARTSIRETKIKGKMSIEQLRSYVSEYTTKEALARELESFEILLPAETLKNKIVIIDTPGTNSLERWHEEVTSRVIRNLSDASIVLISADKPISNTFIDFVSQNLSDVLPRCIFVVTKMDLISTKEQKRQIEYIQKRVKTAFGVDEPIVLPYSSIVVLMSSKTNHSVKSSWVDELQNRDPDLINQLLIDSTKTEKSIIRFLEKNRVTIQLRRLTEMVDSLFADLHDNMIQLQNHYQERRRVLENAAIPDLKEFTQRQVQKHCKAYKLECAIKKQQILNKFSKDAADIYKSKIMPTIYGFQTKQDLEYFMKGLQSYIQNEFNSLLSKNRKRYGKFDALAASQLEVFQREFIKLYENLSILDQDKTAQSKSTNRSVTHNSSSLSYNTKSIIKSIKDSKGAMRGMGLAGAVIGTYMLPVIGTIIGGAIGATIGWFFEPSLEDMQNNCWSKLEESYPQVESEMTSILSQEIDSQIDLFNTFIASRINAYYKEYGATVAKIMKSEVKVKKQYDKSISNLQDDLAQIEKRKAELTINMQTYGIINNGE